MEWSEFKTKYQSSRQRSTLLMEEYVKNPVDGFQGLARKYNTNIKAISNAIYKGKESVRLNNPSLYDNYIRMTRISKIASHNVSSREWLEFLMSKTEVEVCEYLVDYYIANNNLDKIIAMSKLSLQGIRGNYINRHLDKIPTKKAKLYKRIVYQNSRKQMLESIQQTENEFQATVKKMTNTHNQSVKKTNAERREYEKILRIVLLTTRYKNVFEKMDNVMDYEKFVDTLIENRILVGSVLEYLECAKLFGIKVYRNNKYFKDRLENGSNLEKRLGLKVNSKYLLNAVENYLNHEKFPEITNEDLIEA